MHRDWRHTLTSTSWSSARVPVGLGERRASRRECRVEPPGQLPDGAAVTDLTSGFRAARRDCLLEFIHLLPNGFSTPTTTTLAFMKAGYSVRFEPVDAAQRQGTSHIKLGADGVQFVLILLKVITMFSPLRIFLPISLACFVTGAIYAIWTILTQSHVTNSSVLLILMSVVIFLVGLVSEQISALRFEGRS